MNTGSLSNVLKFFGGGTPTAEEKEALFKEVALLTLARATASDTNIKAIEVDETRAIIQRLTRETVTAPDVRKAANSKIYETASLDKYLAKAGRQLDANHRVEIVEALAEVILCDKRVSSAEVDFFNMVAGAFALTPATLAGLIEST
jgi:uncharacterized tellurite resistance protein B-like protein